MDVIYALWDILGIAVWMFVLIGVGWLIIVILSRAVIKVRQGQVAIIERGGKFLRVATPGPSFVIPGLDEIVAEIDCQLIKIHEVQTTARTREQAIVTIPATIRYRIHLQTANLAFYNVHPNISNHIDYISIEVLQGYARSCLLDNMLTSSSELTVALANKFTDELSKYGYEFVSAFVGNITASPEIETTLSKRAALSYKTEVAKAEKLIELLLAEIDVAIKELAGKGMARELEALTAGKIEVAKAEKLVELLLTETDITIKQLAGKGAALELEARATGYAQALIEFGKIEDEGLREHAIDTFKQRFLNEALGRTNMVLADLSRLLGKKDR